MPDARRATPVVGQLTCREGGGPARHNRPQESETMICRPLHSSMSLAKRLADVEGEEACDRHQDQHHIERKVVQLGGSLHTALLGGRRTQEATQP